MKKLVHLATIICIFLWLIGCDQKPVITPSGKTVKIGIIAPFSGPQLANGQEGLKGIETVRQLQPYLRNGDRIELVVADDKNEPTQTVRLLEKLVVKDKVAAIMTLSSSSPVLAMAKSADTYKTPILATFATHPDITAHSGFMNQLGFDDNFQGIVTALFVRDDLLMDSAAVFRNADSAYSTHLASEFEGKFKSIGGDITDSISLNENTDNLEKIMKSVHANDPELLYLPMNAPDVIRIVREVRNLDWQPKIMGSDGLISTILAQHQEEIDLVDGMLTTDFFAHEMPLTAFGKKASDRYNETSNEIATAYVALAAEGYALLLDAMNRCNDPANRDCINRKIRSTSNFEGIIGNIGIGPDGKAQRPLCISTLEGGRSKFLYKVY